MQIVFQLKSSSYYVRKRVCKAAFFLVSNQNHLVTANVIHGGAQVVVFTGKLGAIFLRSNVCRWSANQQHSTHFSFANCQSETNPNPTQHTLLN